MRVAASLLAVLVASLVGAQAAQAQSADKAQPTTATGGKAQGAPKSALPQAQARPSIPALNARSASDSGRAKIEGVSTMPSTPADSKKEGGCHHAQASDA